MSKTASSSSSPISVQTIVWSAVVWAVTSLLFFLLFSVPPEGGDHPLWYFIGIYVLEMGAFLGAALLCFRNWRSPQIVSGRGVWLAIGLGMLCYFLGDFIFGCWEVIWKQDPAVSPADFFFILNYIFVAWGILLAIFPRRLNLEIYQWGIIAGIAAISIFLAYTINSSSADSQAKLMLTPPAIAETITAQAPESAVESPVPADPASIDSENSAAADADTAEAEPSPAPAWVLKLDQQLAPLESYVGLMYIIADIILVILATALLLAFWGGRFSQSWRMIAAAAFSFYIADMWFFYAVEKFEDYQSGSLLEVFWIFSGILVAVGAALEYDVSTRSRRGAGRRRS
ncbi:MAG: hypothetical protein F6K19_01855 [Cyanothece sp. SIO1E1]|nr:hypothetical protein [Cyanothece sp. SIO1E1]